jgi:membrane associated rhomboid family serine protease
MPPLSDSRYAFLYGTQRAEIVPVLERALERAGIPYHSGLLADPEPHIVFTVPEGRLEEAKRLVDHHVGGVVESKRFGASSSAFDEDDDMEAERAWEAARVEEERERRQAKFPKGPLQAAGAIILVHLAVLFGFVGRDPDAAHLASLGGLVRGAGAVEPWRLVSSLFLHSGLRHVVWNGLSMIVFAVPAILAWGYGRASLLYIASGIGGGLAALLAHPAGTVVVGSSGAVAGLFGAWLVVTLRRARRSPMTKRALVRTVGIGLLVLPSLVTPATVDGKSISVAAHLGGLATGAAVGWLLDLLGARSSHA